MPKKANRKVSTYDLPNDEKRAMGARMKECREIAKISQTDAAARLGYTQPVQLSLMESGQRPVPTRVLIEAARLYGTTTDYLCGLVDDSDRDPTNAVSRHLVARLTADMQHLIREVASRSTDVVRELLPSAGEAQRVAAAVVEVNMAMARFQQRNPGFEDMPGGAPLQAKLITAADLAARYLDHIERARRMLATKSLRESERVAARYGQLDLLAGLDLQPAREPAA